MFVYSDFIKKEKINMQRTNILTTRKRKTISNQPYQNKRLLFKMNQQTKCQELFPRASSFNKQTKGAPYTIRGV